MWTCCFPAPKTCSLPSPAAPVAPWLAGEHFRINLRAPPYSLGQPEEVLDEQHEGKLLLRYSGAALRAVDWGAARLRCYAKRPDG